VIRLHRWVLETSFTPRKIPILLKRGRDEITFITSPTRGTLPQRVIYRGRVFYIELKTVADILRSQVAVSQISGYATCKNLEDGGGVSVKFESDNHSNVVIPRISPTKGVHQENTRNEPNSFRGVRIASRFLSFH
jgi:hypothetical protein